MRPPFILTVENPNREISHFCIPPKKCGISRLSGHPEGLKRLAQRAGAGAGTITQWLPLDWPLTISCLSLNEASAG